MDVDWLPLRFIDRSDIHDFEQFSQEICWAADVGDRLTYTLGGYIDQNELDMQGQVVIDTNFGACSRRTLRLRMACLMRPHR